MRTGPFRKAFSLSLSREYIFLIISLSFSSQPVTLSVYKQQNVYSFFSNTLCRSSRSRCIGIACESWHQSAVRSGTIRSEKMVGKLARVVDMSVANANVTLSIDNKGYGLGGTVRCRLQNDDINLLGNYIPRCISIA